MALVKGDLVITMNKLAHTDNNSSQLFLRLTLGVVMFPHGAQKVFGWFGGAGFYKTIQLFSDAGINPAMTILLMVVELIGSLLLIFGIFTRIWALGIGVTITVCMFANHIQNGFFMNWLGQQQGEGYEYHLLVIGISLVLLIKGGGMLSVDQKYTPQKRFRPLV